MSETERNSIIKGPGISQEARAFNTLTTDGVIQGIKTAAMLNRKIIEAERVQEETNKNPVKKDNIPIPTGAEIRRAREEGEYR